MSTENKRRGRPISTVRGVLRRALTLIQNGWTKGAWDTKGARRGRRCFCAAGAIREATGDNQLLDAARGTLRDCIGESSIEGWNDNYHRTKRDVVRAFKTAIRFAA